MNQKISIMGWYPPPYGGVSVHIKRLVENLQLQGRLNKVYLFEKNPPKEFPTFTRFCPKFRYTFIEYLWWFFYYGIFDKAKIIHIHNNEYGAFVFLPLKFIFRKSLIFTIHDTMRLQNVQKYFVFKYFVFLLFKQRKIQWIAVNDIIKQQLITLGVKSDQICIIPAYIKNQNISNLPFKYHSLIKSRFPIICLYAYRTPNKEVDTDIYGIMFTLKVFPYVIKHFPNAMLIISLPGDKNPTMMDIYEKFIKNNNLLSNVIFITEALQSLEEIFKISSVYLRPTLSDGDSLAIREALVSGCQVIASDIVIRPLNCITFKSNNIEDFLIKIISALENKWVKKYQEQIDGYIQILNIYDKKRIM